MSVCLVLVLSVLPDVAPTDAEGADKVFHALAYLVLGGGAAFSLPAALWRPAVIGVILYGWAIEGLQAALPWRSAEVIDGTVNTLAVLAGTIIARALIKESERLEDQSSKGADIE
ncbi:hypothetical protein [Rhodovibrio salinarum]|uniref:VanZ like family protein n=1 Tax=Rhodovibrio salinarum TaxID=1087 RepID=A0A934QLG1_9PROT|nr:hypothetical protein [Rhodovibrio salinarum]MBK1698700.1 hypothetical protein [Rhodovibrio salinarum]